MRITPLALAGLLAGLTGLAGCGPRESESSGLTYATARAEPRNVAVEVRAAGVIEPKRTVELKSKASGEILELEAETGDVVARGKLLVRIDPRTARNRLAQAEADLEAARARLVRANAQLGRAKQLLENQWINQADYDQAVLDAATARSEVVSAGVAVENARIALEDTEIRAPIDGTIVSKLVERGQVISSPIQDVSGGTLLLTMANLDDVQVRARVDETDVGKIRPGATAAVTVTSYPAQAFSGVIQKIEPQAVVDQNVTLFNVILGLGNRDGLLKPGMNVEIQVDVVHREGVLTVPVAALRTSRDYAATAGLLGIEESALRSQLAVDAPSGNGAANPSSPSSGSSGAASAAGNAAGLSGRFWVVRVAGGRYLPTPVTTGITDLDQVEITAGLSAGDEVLLLPSASLVQVQQDLQKFVNRRFGGIPGITQRDTTRESAAEPARDTPAAPR